MEFYEKKAEDPERHLAEYTEYQRSLPNYLKKEDFLEFLRGFLSNIGFKAKFVPVQADGQVFFPFLDPYWERAGRVYLSEAELEKTRLMTIRLKIADCLRAAERRGELSELIDLARQPNMQNWLRFGG